MSKWKRERIHYTTGQRDYLEDKFKSYACFTKRDYAEFAKALGVSEERVRIWFQNRRQKAKNAENREHQHNNRSQKKLTQNGQSVAQGLPSLECNQPQPGGNSSQFGYNDLAKLQSAYNSMNAENYSINRPENQSFLFPADFLAHAGDFFPTTAAKYTMENNFTPPYLNTANGYQHLTYPMYGYEPFSTYPMYVNKVPFMPPFLPLKYFIQTRNETSLHSNHYQSPAGPIAENGFTESDNSSESSKLSNLNIPPNQNYSNEKYGEVHVENRNTPPIYSYHQYPPAVPLVNGFPKKDTDNFSEALRFSKSNFLPIQNRLNQKYDDLHVQAMNTGIPPIYSFNQHSLSVPKVESSLRKADTDNFSNEETRNMPPP